MAVLETFAGVPGEEAFESWSSGLLQKADEEVRSELVSDPTLASLTGGREADVGSLQEAPRTPVFVAGIYGIPGEENFEAELSSQLEEFDDQLKDELSTDPTRQP